MSQALDHDALDRLVRATPTAPVLSVYLRTDPRDAGNAAARTALASGLKAVADRAGERDHKLAFRELHDRLLADVVALHGAERGRSVAWFVALDGSLDERFTLKLAPPDASVHLDARPYVAPAVDLVERGAPTAIVLVGRERVRMLEWAHGHIEEAVDLTLDDALDRDPEHRVSSQSGHAVSYSEDMDSRAAQQRDRFLHDAAHRLTDRLLQADRIVFAATGDVVTRMRRALPDQVNAKVRLLLDHNFLGLSATDVAARIEPHLEAVHHADALSLAETLRSTGGAAGAAEVLAALAQRQVETLLIDPRHVPDTSTLPPIAADALNSTAPELVGEHAVQAALGAGARIASLAVADSPALAEADGMLARLRW